MKRVLALVAVLGTLVTAPATRATTTIPAGLPRHFGIGLTAHPDSTGIYGWMPNSKIPWDYAYQYLAAGVNTGQGWRAWGENATFPLSYAKGAAGHGYVPVFPYYMLLQSNGPCATCGEAEKDLAHLNSPDLMRRYYADFALLMKRLGPGTYGGVEGFGGTAIVHVEPDLSGYAMQAVVNTALCYGHCTGTGNDPSLLKASVKSSGFPAAQGFPNTYRGFNLTLLQLRDRYAPNVLLAFHISDWMTLYDVGSSHDASLDWTALGRKAARFASLSGVAGTPNTVRPYDLLFNDVADRDAGYYRDVHGINVWWDRRNVELPNFHVWEEYLGAVTSATGKPAIVWQIPEGNQYFRSVNQTEGHYQDNRAEYLLHHIGELERIGVIALLFGRGNGGSTTHTDAEADGVTNPPAICTSAGTSGAEICNDHAARYADDDGGYLRIQARRYYRDPLALH